MPITGESRTRVAHGTGAVAAAAVAILSSTALVGCATGERSDAPVGRFELESIASSDTRWTGLAISAGRRIFVNYPLWSDSQAMAVGELQADGSVLPYPDRRWNEWRPGLPPEEHFVCVQALLVDDASRLWILDPGNPRFEGVIEGAPKIVIVDLSTDTVERTIRFEPDVVPPDSYLNDLRVDRRAGVAYLTDSGNGALVVLDIESGRARRVLEDHASTQSQNIDLVIGNRLWRMGDQRPQVHADGIALSRDRRWLSYQPLTGRTMWRVPTAALRDESLDDSALAGRVERVADAGASDGLITAPDGWVWISALEQDAIVRVHPDGRFRTVITDPRISWPDSFALGPDETIYFTTARIHEGDAPSAPFGLWRVRPRSN